MRIPSSLYPQNLSANNTAAEGTLARTRLLHVVESWLEHLRDRLLLEDTGASRGGSTVEKSLEDFDIGSWRAEEAVAAVRAAVGAREGSGAHSVGVRRGRRGVRHVDLARVGCDEGAVRYSKRPGS